MNKQEEIKIQDHVADFYEQKRYKKEYSRRFHKFWFDKIVEMVQPQGLILDNGCGTGELMEFLNSREVVGCDISFNMLKNAKKRSNFLVKCDSEKLPFKDKSFDVVYVKALLHHLNDIDSAIQEIKRVLKPGGEVVFAETNKNFINDLPRRLMKKGEHFSESHQNFRDKQLISMISKELKIQKVSYFGYIAYTLLGFPDIMDIYRFVPLKNLFTPLLIFIDKILSNIPFVKKLAFCIIISAKKK